MAPDSGAGRAARGGRRLGLPPPRRALSAPCPLPCPPLPYAPPFRRPAALNGASAVPPAAAAILSSKGRWAVGRSSAGRHAGCARRHRPPTDDTPSLPLAAATRRRPAVARFSGAVPRGRMRAYAGSSATTHRRCCRLAPAAATVLPHIARRPPVAGPLAAHGWPVRSSARPRDAAWRPPDVRCRTAVARRRRPPAAPPPPRHRTRSTLLPVVVRSAGAVPTRPVIVAGQSGIHPLLARRRYVANHARTARRQPLAARRHGPVHRPARLAGCPSPHRPPPSSPPLYK
ncbi:uncharacterized protein A4U43_C08F23410 [Asparagus officinalis]|nr:uncharacterized protein A4U43_C08F23410 [Asparagus officinalis]